MFDLTLESVVQMDCLFRDAWNIPVMEKVIKERFHGKYPVRKSIETNFAHVGGRLDFNSKPMRSHTAENELARSDGSVQS